MDQPQESILDGSSIQRNANLEFALKRAIFDRRIRKDAGKVLGHHPQLPQKMMY